MTLFPNPPCEGHTDLFYPPERGSKNEVRWRQAKRICRMCPYRAACLEHAIREREFHGVWGGTDPSERGRLAGRRWAA